MKSSVEGSEFKFEGIVHTNQLEPRYATGSNRKYCKVYFLESGRTCTCIMQLLLSVKDSEG